MSLIYLSAHPDDAVLSCGGLISDQVRAGTPVEVWTFMCGAPSEKMETYLKRRDEDKKAVELLGAKGTQFGISDAPFRLDSLGVKLYESVFSPVHIQDEKTIIFICDRIKSLLRAGDELMCPLAVGEHVDHVILRKACEKTELDFTYYVDFPYTEYLPLALGPASAGLISHPQSITPEGLAHWLDAVCEYKSQDFYPTQIITRGKIIEYWQDIRGIFLWRKK